jgi:hypothetical protein
MSSDEEKLLRLAQFHERNQKFLKQSQNNNNMMSGDNNNNSDISRLNDRIMELQLQVRQLTHELETTRDAYQLSSDKSRAEIAMLQSQIEHTNARHEKITDSLRSRLVESELARIQMQDQLVASFDTKTKDEEEIKNRWMQMTSTVAEEKKWVDEQMDHWKESMEGRRSRLHDAKMRGTIDAAGVGEDSLFGADKDVEEKGSGKGTVAGRRSRQRQLWGKGDYNDSKDNDDDDDGIESERIFGGK